MKEVIALQADEDYYYIQLIHIYVKDVLHFKVMQKIHNWILFTIPTDKYIIQLTLRNHNQIEVPLTNKNLEEIRKAEIKEI